MCANAHLDLKTFGVDGMIQNISGANKKVVVQCIFPRLVHGLKMGHIAPFEDTHPLSNMFPFLKLLFLHFFFPFTPF